MDRYNQILIFKQSGEFSYSFISVFTDRNKLNLAVDLNLDGLTDICTFTSCYINQGSLSFSTVANSIISGGELISVAGLKEPALLAIKGSSLSIFERHRDVDGSFVFPTELATIATGVRAFYIIDLDADLVCPPYSFYPFLCSSPSPPSALSLGCSPVTLTLIQTPLIFHLCGLF